MKQQLILLLLPFALAPLSSAFAEECFSYETVQVHDQTNDPAMKRMNDVSSKMMGMMDPALVKQNAETKARMARPQKVKNYLNSRYLVSVYDSQWDVTDYTTMDTLHVDSGQKTYVTMNMMKLGALGMASSTAAMKVAGGSNENSAAKPTGKTLKIKGIPCTEVSERMTISARGMGGKPGKSFTTTTKCVSTAEPAAFFRLKKSHLELSKIKGPGGVEPFILSTATKTGETDDPKFSQVAVMMSHKEVTSIGAECPPANYLKAPSGYRNLGK